jgi:CDP-glucose 4,6-dehydratase
VNILDFYRGKRVFLTGHTGFKGTWLCRLLLEAGAELCGYALEPPPGPSLFSETALAENMLSLIGDVRDGGSLADAMAGAKPEIVFHLAAQPLVRRAYRESALTYETNVMGTVNILEALRETPSVRSFVNVTTDKVYENREWHWGYREIDTLNGYDPYSNSKSCSDLITASYRASFFAGSGAAAISTARAGNVIGGGDYSEDRIIPDCVRAASTKRTIVVRNPQSIRPYQHVLDCLSGYLLLAQKQFLDKSFAGAYNFAPPEDGCISAGAITDLFCAAWGDGISWTKSSGESGPHEAVFLKLDCAKAKAVLGWKPRWNIKTAVEKTVAFAHCETNQEKTACIKKQIGEYLAICGDENKKNMETNNA